MTPPYFYEVFIFETNENLTLWVVLASLQHYLGYARLSFFFKYEMLNRCLVLKITSFQFFSQFVNTPDTMLSVALGYSLLIVNERSMSSDQQKGAKKC